MQRNFFLITISDLLFEFAHSLVFIFGVLFFYQKLGESVLLAVIPVALIHLVHGSLLKFFVEILFKIGIKKSLTIGALFYSLASILIYFDSQLSVGTLVLWVLFNAIGNIFHYIPVIYILGHNTTDINRPRLFSLRKIAFILLAIIHPLLGGLTAQFLNLNGTMLIALILYIGSIIPVIAMNDFKLDKKLNLHASLQTVESKKIILFKIGRVITENFNILWPLFIFLLFKDSFLQVGILFTIVNFISILIAYTVGKIVNRKNELKIFDKVKWTSTFAWFFRAFTFNYITALITDTVYKLNEVFRSSVSDVIDFELMNNSKHSDIKIEFIVIREITTNIATAIFYILSAILITYFGFYDSFIIIGIVGFIAMSLVERSLNKKS